ncbi:MAG: hypothetical protein Q9219_001813 [cf. Caloplaca sp. 3 TL-2023]
MLLFERHSFLSRRRYIASFLALFTVLLCFWQLPVHNSFSLQPGPSSGRIYDLYIDGSQHDSTHQALSTAFNDSDPDPVDKGDHESPKPSADFKTSALGLPFKLYDPYPTYNSVSWKQKWHGAHVGCEGPRGIDVNGNADDMLGAYELPNGALTPSPIFGAYHETGLGSGYCFERHARNSPYGDEDRPDDDPTDRPQPSKVLWERVDWGRLQRDCYIRNRNRFDEKPNDVHASMFRFPTHEDTLYANDTLILPENMDLKMEKMSAYKWLWSGSRQDKSYKKRNAILLRTYSGKEYKPDDLFHIRSMITELSLHSGAEYEVFLLVQIKDLKQFIFSDPAVYQAALDQHVPPSHMTQPLQLFSLLRPDFDLYWQFELDVRYTGHHYHHLEAIQSWARKQPRRLLWERNAYFYSPYIHKTWENFCNTIRRITDGSGIWGALTTTGISPVGPKSPTDFPEEDEFEWGVGEPADMINVSPIIEPVRTHMLFRDLVENYPDGKEKTPRRAAPVTPLIAVSKRLLRAMHHSQITMGTHMMPEMYPESTALQHGLKAVTFPEPFYMDTGDESPERLESIFNNQTEEGIWNGWSPNKKLPRRVSYWWSNGYKFGLSNRLYRKWLGIDFEGKKVGEQRLCLPAVLLHPIKGI